MAKTKLSKLLLLAILLAIVVVVLGAFTRLVNAGLGCPDWPGCYGHLTWPNSALEIEKAEMAFPDAPVDLDKTWPEMVHRYFAGSLLLVVALLTLVTRRKQGLPNLGVSAEDLAPLKTLAPVLLVLIICQAAFGAWTVTLKLWPQVVTAHLLGGFATLSMLWAMFLRSEGAPALSLSHSQATQIRRHRILALGVVIIQITLGGWVSSNYAALACADFPTCYNSYWPQMDWVQGFNLLQSVGPNYLGGLLDSEARIAIHWSHRLGAIVVLFVVAGLAWRLWSSNRVLACLVAGILAVQVLLGVLNIVWALPLTIATAHNACGALLLLSVVAVNFAPRR